MADSGKETRGPRAVVFTENFSREREREGRKERTKGSLSPRAVGYSAAGYFRVNRSSYGGCYRGIISFVRRLDLRMLRIKYARLFLGAAFLRQRYPAPFFDN